MKSLYKVKSQRKVIKKSALIIRETRLLIIVIWQQNKWVNLNNGLMYIADWDYL